MSQAWERRSYGRSLKQIRPQVIGFSRAKEIQNIEIFGSSIYGGCGRWQHIYLRLARNRVGIPGASARNKVGISKIRCTKRSRSFPNRMHESKSYLLVWVGGSARDQVGILGICCTRSGRNLLLYQVVVLSAGKGRGRSGAEMSASTDVMTVKARPLSGAQLFSLAMCRSSVDILEGGSSFFTVFRQQERCSALHLFSPFRQDAF